MVTMVTRFTAGIFLVCGVSGFGAAQDVSARLELSAEPAVLRAPYRRGTLVIDNGLAETIDAVSLRASDGGPTQLLPVTVPPGRTSRVEVALPATSLEQVYTVKLFDRYSNGRADSPAARLLGEAQAVAHWPIGDTGATGVVDVASRQIVNGQAFGPFVERQSQWPLWLRRLALTVLSGMVVLTGFVLLVPGRWLRAGALVVVIAGAATALWGMAEAAPLTIEATALEVCQRGPDDQEELWTLTLLTARRTRSGQADLAGAACAYLDRPTMAADDTLLRPAEPAFSNGVPVEFHLAPHETKMLVRRTVLPAGQGSPGRATVQVTDAGETWSLQCDKATPAAILRVGPRFVPVEPMAAQTPRRLRRDRAQLLDLLRAKPEAYGFDAGSMRLFTWWDLTQYQPGRMYLIWLDRSGGRVCLFVSAVVEQR